MDSSKSKRVVLYCRAATQAQLDGDHTLEAQSVRLHEYAGRNEYEIMGEVRAYEKGVTLDRDGWKTVCRLAAEKKAGLILVTQLDRVTRDMWPLPQALSALAENGVWLQVTSKNPPIHRSLPFYVFFDPSPQKARTKCAVLPIFRGKSSQNMEVFSQMGIVIPYIPLFVSK